MANSHFIAHSEPDLRALSYHELHSGEARQWLWQGYLAPANISLLTSQWKAGKTTLVAALLHHMKDGGTLAGRAVLPGHAVVLSEEDPALWHERGRLFDYCSHVCWYCRPFRGKPTAEQFQALLEKLLAQHAAKPFHLLVIDSLAAFLPPGCENNADAIVAFLGSLHQLTDVGVAILILHHPRKKPAGEGQAARGSGALLGTVDVLIEMHWVARPSSGDRRRRLKAWSRHKDTPPRLVIELNEAGTDYAAVAVPEKPPPHEDELRPALREVLADAGWKLTRQQILENWPRHSREPTPNQLWRWLDRAVRARLVLRDGEGSRDEPHRFWLPEREQEWNANPLMRLACENLENHLREQRQKRAAIAAAIAQELTPPLNAQATTPPAG